MKKLQLKQIDNAQESEIIEIDDRITIGRHSENDLILRFESVSRYHCLVYVDDDHKVFVKDLNSSNGTFVNNERIDRVQVAEYDVLQVGPVKFEFVAADEFDTQKGLVPQPEATLKSLLNSPAAQARIESVRIRSTEDPTVQFERPVNTVATIGRLQFSDIFLDDLSVSRNHATLEVRQDRVVLADTTSTNGTFINGEKITRQELHDGDTFSIGKQNHFTISFVLDTRDTFKSLQQRDQLMVVDSVEDAPKMLALFQREYGDEVLAEIERQAAAFWEEFARRYTDQPHSEQQQTALIKGLRLLTTPAQILDNKTLETRLAEQTPLDGIDLLLLQQIRTMTREYQHRRILYFEAAAPDDVLHVRTNGIIVHFQPDFHVLLFGIPYERLPYLLYIAPWLAQFQKYP